MPVSPDAPQKEAPNLDTVDCCHEHDGPHVHGCTRPRYGGQTHRGACELADGRRELPAAGVPSTLTREVRVIYGVDSVTVSVVDLVHNAITWRPSAELVSIKQWTRDDFEAHALDFLEEQCATLLAPMRRVGEGARTPVS
jgi:hypothetical protein